MHFLLLAVSKEVRNILNMRHLRLVLATAVFCGCAGGYRLLEDRALELYRAALLCEERSPEAEPPDWMAACRQASEEAATAARLAQEEEGRKGSASAEAHRRAQKAALALGEACRKLRTSPCVHFSEKAQ